MILGAYTVSATSFSVATSTTTLIPGVSNEDHRVVAVLKVVDPGSQTLAPEERCTPRSVAMFPLLQRLERKPGAALGERLLQELCIIPAAANVKNSMVESGKRQILLLLA